MILKIKEKAFAFSFHARTSRGTMQERICWFAILEDEDAGVQGIGECAPLPGLSMESMEEAESMLEKLTGKADGWRIPSSEGEVFEWSKTLIPSAYSSVRMAMETAWLDCMHGGKRVVFPNSFVQGVPIPINGLVWMGDENFMENQVQQRLNQGYDCIKIKIGGIDFEKELALLHRVRANFKGQLRLDANGAFTRSDVLTKLEALSQFDIHSLEQPLPAGDTFLKELIRQSPIPIALDEELIPHLDYAAKAQMMDTLHPSFIVLKPTLHGGFSGCREWIELAELHGAKWWLTSALESNVGLNAICQFAAAYPVDMPQGLGTGLIYSNNVPSPLEAQGGYIRYAAERSWDMHGLSA